MSAPPKTSKPDRRRLYTAIAAVAAVMAMVGASFAAVPLYKMFCKVTGYGGTTQVATAGPSRVLDRTIEVSFDTNVAQGLPVRFRPEAPRQTLRIGETGLAFFEVENLSDQPVRAVATFNVVPFSTGPFFQKLQCFCFSARSIGPHERQSLPVLYFVDPSIADDPDARDVRQITLSYTFFPAPAGGGVPDAAR